MKELSDKTALREADELFRRVLNHDRFVEQDIEKWTEKNKPLYWLPQAPH